jgi:hypothetical protein
MQFALWRPIVTILKRDLNGLMSIILLTLRLSLSHRKEIEKSFQQLRISSPRTIQNPLMRQSIVCLLNRVER